MDYARLARNVAKTLAKYGRDVTLRQYAEGAGEYDPSSLTVSTAGSTPIDQVRKALVTEQPGTRIGPQYGTNFKADTLIQDAQKWIYMDASGNRPRPNDLVFINTEKFTITDVQETAPGGIPVFYLIVLNR